MRYFFFLSLAACLGFVSCSPMGGYPGAQSRGVGSQGVSGAGAAGNSGASVASGAGSVGSALGRPTASELQELRQRREAQGASSGSNSAGEGDGSVGSSGVETLSDSGAEAPLPPMEIGYRYAMPVPGRSGWVYNPFTHTSVDARGVESGRLIYDETDPANRNADGTLKPIEQMPHKFRVP